MLKLYENEKIIIAFHRHWIVVASKMTLAAALLLIPLVILIAMPSIEISSELRLVIFYLIMIYLMIVAMIAFVLWIDYYLDVWIVTDSRIIDLEQKGMFKRETSEFLLSKVQDITVEIPSFTATLLHYGNLRVQTAGEENFTAYDIPHVDEVKNIILTEAKKANGANWPKFQN
ncbi:MAG: PH domain-containing protein [Patescibacteria group bacterium]